MRRPRSDRRPSADPFAGIRIEHRRPDGSVRLLAETTMLSVAQQTATSWAKRLHRDGQRGTVALVRTASGEVIAERAIADATP
jgi:hypothetical protein